MTMPCVTLKHFKCKQKQNLLDKFLEIQRPSESQEESSGTKRQKIEREGTPETQLPSLRSVGRTEVA